MTLQPQHLGVSRNINVPGLSVTVGDMVSALERVAGADVANRIQWKADARIERIVSSWPGALDSRRALSLGFPRDENFDAFIRQYMRDEMSAH